MRFARLIVGCVAVVGLVFASACKDDSDCPGVTDSPCPDSCVTVSGLRIAEVPKPCKAKFETTLGCRASQAIHVDDTCAVRSDGVLVLMNEKNIDGTIFAPCNDAQRATVNNVGYCGD